MNKEKQIEDMAKDVCPLIEEYGNCEKCDAELGIEDDPCIYKCMAKLFASKGYRKASDIAVEIFAEIEENLNNLIRNYEEKRKYVTEVEYSEFDQRYCDIKIRTFEERLLKMSKLKKKYTEGKND